MNAIRIRNAERRFGERVVLDDVSLEISGGEFVALLGRSGSGKSTLLNLIAGIESLDGGEICLDDQRIDHIGEPERTLLRRKAMGFVFQAFHLIPTLTVLENVELPLALNDDESATTASYAASLVERLGLSGFESRYPETLSGGEQQRVAVARALVHKPRVVLADEPTGNLDSETGLRVVELLEELCRESKITLLLATHDQELAARADRRVTLIDGRLATQ